MADKLAARGDDLVLLARTEARAAELAERFPGAQTFATDLADPASIRVPDLDRLDSVLHVAGVVDLGAGGRPARRAACASRSTSTWWRRPC